MKLEELAKFSFDLNRAKADLILKFLRGAGNCHGTFFHDHDLHPDRSPHIRLSPTLQKILSRYLPEPDAAHTESGNIPCPVFANSFWSTKGANANSILIHPMRSHSNKTYSKIKKSGSGDGILGVSNQCGLEDIWPPGIGQYYRHFANPERYGIPGSIWAPIAFFRIQNPSFHGATVNIFEKYRLKRLFSKTERFKPKKNISI